MVTYDQNEEIGKILKQKRKAMSLTMHEVSEKSCVSASHLSRIEQGDRFPSASVLRRLAEPLGFTETELMILAGYLSPAKPGIAEEGREYRGSKLDPYVARVLSQEPPEVQRAVINILELMKRTTSTREKKKKS